EELERQRLELEQKIQDVHQQYERAKSMAQLTRQGYVYIISNIGSFGENVFKIGMTRRLEPMERVKELSGAAVPFDFDVHAMISCDDAPALEKTLHDHLENYRIN
ncbi:GIY-YIG nuclease family protein, partial [Klebsiella pneumoniae]|nr:GIY-YIG nuclease family protein [Klebsiella pneumoniae]